MSTTSQPAYFGRAWKLKMTTLDGEEVTLSNSDWDTEALRVAFSVTKIYHRYLWFADISIWNLSPSTEQLALQQGCLVQLWAGYQKNFSDGNNLIFSGSIFQPIWERESVVDYRVTLRCIVGLPEFVSNLVSFTQGPGATQAHIVQRMAKEARNQVPMETTEFDSSLSQQVLPRSKTVFGRPVDYFAQIAESNGFPVYLGDNGVNLRPIDFQPETTPDIVYAPPYLTNIPNSQSVSGITKQTIIGAVQQTQEGVFFQVLLDSDVQIGKIVKIVGASIRQVSITIGERPPLLDKDGLYLVLGLRHVGNTLGNEWFTEITAVTWRYWGQATGKMSAQ